MLALLVDTRFPQRGQQVDTVQAMIETASMVEAMPPQTSQIGLAIWASMVVVTLMTGNVRSARAMVRAVTKIESAACMLVARVHMLQLRMLPPTLHHLHILLPTHTPIQQVLTRPTSGQLTLVPEPRDTLLLAALANLSPEHLPHMPVQPLLMPVHLRLLHQVPEAAVEVEFTREDIS